MSPMNRMRTANHGPQRRGHQTSTAARRSARSDWNVNRLPAPLDDFGHADPQLAVGEDGARPGGIARGREAHRAGEASEAAFDQVKARVASAAADRLLAGDENR